MGGKKTKEQNQKDAQAYRNRLKAQGKVNFPVIFSPIEMKKLKEICEFFAYPDEPYSQSDAISSLVNRVHREIGVIKAKLGTCKMCGEQLPMGCAKLREGGLFKGDANCFHTTQRVRIYDPSKEAGQ